MKKILIKEIDIKFDGDSVISEYLIYYIENGENINAYIELGEHNKNKRVDFLKAIKGPDILIEEMNHEAYLNQK